MKTRIETRPHIIHCDGAFSVARESMKTRIETCMCKCSLQDGSKPSLQESLRKQGLKLEASAISAIPVFLLQENLRKQGLKRVLLAMKLRPSASCKRVYENKD